MNIKHFILAAVLVGASPTHAATVSYTLDQSNALSDGTDYLRVTLSESAGGVDFLVETLDALDELAKSNFGIQSFGFNFTSNTLYDIEGLPRGWREQSNRQMSEFGRYDIVLQGKGNARTDALSFSVSGVDLSDLDTFFAAHVAGFEWCLTDPDNGHDGDSDSGHTGRNKQHYLSKHDSWKDDRDRDWRDHDWRGDDSDHGKSCPGGKDCITSAYFGGGSHDAIPLPASVWLLGSGMLGFISMVRRKNAERGR